MKRRFLIIFVIIAFVFAVTSFSLFGCAEETKHQLTVIGGELLYEPTEESYKAGEEVAVKVKITPHQNTFAYIDSVQLVKSKSSQNDYYVFTFTMPDNPATLSIGTVKGFEDALLTGFHLTFYDKDNNSIESLNKEFDNPEAVARYYYSYIDENSGYDVTTSNEGADVFGNGTVRSMIDAAWGLKELEFDCTLYFTYEMADSVAFVDWVYFNQRTGELDTDDGIGNTLNTVVSSSSTFNKQNLSETRYTVAGEEYEATFASKVTIEFEYIDYLTNVKVLEYDENNQLIKAGEVTGKERFETFTVSENCEYAVIEEEYTVMSGEKKDEKHYERTLINKTDFGSGKTLKYPRGDGLISPVRLSIRWADTQTE